MRAKEAVGGNRVGEDEWKRKPRGFPGEKEKEGEGGCGTDRGGMKGKGTMCGKTQGKKKEMKLPDYIQEDT